MYDLGLTVCKIGIRILISHPRIVWWIKFNHIKHRANSSYFGEHVLQSKEWHFDKLKVFLNDNPQIDLSVDLIEAYVDADGKYTHDSIQSVIRYKRPYSDVYSSYGYDIQMVICEMLYKKGGMDLVKRMLFETPNDKAVYNSIERLLGIKREQMNQAIRGYLEEIYWVLAVNDFKLQLKFRLQSDNLIIFLFRNTICFPELLYFCPK